MADIIHDHSSLRAEQIGWTHKVDLRWFHYPNGTTHSPDTHHLPMSIDDAEDLMVSLQQAIRQARDRQLDDARRGQCDTCKGVRMVSKEVHGRMVHSHSHCPDCPPADVWEGPMPPEMRAAKGTT
jgi:hypothetical protein